MVYDPCTRLSCGFAFVYLERIDDSKEAIERAYGIGMQSRRIHVDYSLTKKAQVYPRHLHRQTNP